VNTEQHLAQVQRDDAQHVARVSVTVQALRANVAPLTEDGAASSRGFLLNMFQAGVSPDGSPSPIPWAALASVPAQQPIVTFLHEDLDWFGVVSIGNVSLWSSAATDLAVRLALPTGGATSTLPDVFALL
jgi:hypothetical protein